MSKFEEAGAGGGSAVDPIWDAVFGQPLGDQESEQESFEPLPRLDHGYGLKFESAEGRLVGKDGYPTVHFGLRVTSGPAGAANRVVWDDIFLVPFPRQGESPADAAGRLRALLTRLRNHFKLAQERPLGRDAESLGVWGRQFVGKDAVAGLRVEGERTDKDSGRTYAARNRVIWEGIGAPDSPVLDKKTKQPTGQTYAQRAAEEVAAYEKKQAGGGPTGKRAGSALGAPTPTSFFGGGVPS